MSHPWRMWRRSSRAKSPELGLTRSWRSGRWSDRGRSRFRCRWRGSSLGFEGNLNSIEFGIDLFAFFVCHPEPLEFSEWGCEESLKTRPLDDLLHVYNLVSTPVRSKNTHYLACFGSIYRSKLRVWNVAGEFTMTICLNGIKTTIIPVFPPLNILFKMDPAIETESNSQTLSILLPWGTSCLTNSYNWRCWKRALYSAVNCRSSRLMSLI